MQKIIFESYHPIRLCEECRKFENDPKEFIQFSHMFCGPNKDELEKLFKYESSLIPKDHSKLPIEKSACCDGNGFYC